MTRERTRIASAKKLETIIVKRRSVLRVVRGIGAGAELQLAERPVRAGRSDDADLILDDPAASRNHFEVTPYRGGYVLRDLGSTNGTAVNHISVVECRLANGDIITVGETDVAYVEETQVGHPE